MNRQTIGRVLVTMQTMAINGIVTASQADIAEQAMVSVSSVQRAIDILVTKGLIKVLDSDGTTMVNQYKVGVF